MLSTKSEAGFKLQFQSHQNSEALSPGTRVAAVTVRCLYSGRHFPASSEVTYPEGDPGSPVGTYHHDIDVPNMTDCIPDTLPNTEEAFDHSRCVSKRKEREMQPE